MRRYTIRMVYRWGCLVGILLIVAVVGRSATVILSLLGPSIDNVIQAAQPSPTYAPLPPVFILTHPTAPPPGVDYVQTMAAEQTGMAGIEATHQARVTDTPAPTPRDIWDRINTEYAERAQGTKQPPAPSQLETRWAQSTP